MFVGVAVFAGALACHRAPHVQPAPDPAALLAQARAEVRRGDFAHALLNYRRATYELGPTDSTMPEAQFYIAECEFQTGDRVQAAHDFRHVADQYPTSEYAPLALLRAGDANLRLWHDPELDPSYGQAALAIYQELAGRYPDSPPAARAQAHVKELREWFAEKDYKNGMFYFRRRAYDSAIIYFKDVIATYTGTSWVAPALLRLADSYKAIGYADELKETCATLRRFYPTDPGINQRCPPAAAADSSATPS